jgi:hypothetical protein
MMFQILPVAGRSVQASTALGKSNRDIAAFGNFKTGDRRQGGL